VNAMMHGRVRAAEPEPGSELESGSCIFNVSLEKFCSQNPVIKSKIQNKHLKLTEAKLFQG
jgi:hypothetical protein